MAKHRANGEGMVRKRKDGRWEARYTDKRELDPKKRVKSITGRVQKDVVDKLNKALAEIAEGEKLLVADSSTVADWLPIWLREYKINELRDSTYEAYERNIEQHIIPILGHIKLKALTGQQIQQMFNKLQEPKKIGGHQLSSASVAKVKNILSGALAQAVIRWCRQ